MKHSVETSRAELRKLLIEDKVSDAESCSSVIRGFIEDGFEGFNNMSDAALVQCAFDAGLQRYDSCVPGYIATLKEHIAALEIAPLTPAAQG